MEPEEIRMGIPRPVTVSEAEKDKLIAELLALGRTYREICAELRVSPKRITRVKRERGFEILLKRGLARTSPELGLPKLDEIVKKIVQNELANYTAQLKTISKLVEASFSVVECHWCAHRSLKPKRSVGWLCPNCGNFI